jgi:hypothetical protein
MPFLSVWCYLFGKACLLGVYHHIEDPTAAAADLFQFFDDFIQ